MMIVDWRTIIDINSFVRTCNDVPNIETDFTNKSPSHQKIVYKNATGIRIAIKININIAILNASCRSLFGGFKWTTPIRAGQSSITFLKQSCTSILTRIRFSTESNHFRAITLFIGYGYCTSIEWHALWCHMPRITGTICSNDVRIPFWFLNIYGYINWIHIWTYTHTCISNKWMNKYVIYTR